MSSGHGGEAQPVGRGARALQRLVLATSRPPLDRCWAVAYRLLARTAGHALTIGCAPRATVFARGSAASGELAPGISDIDLVIVPERAGDAACVHRRWEALRARAPLLAHLVDRPRAQTPAELALVAGRSPFTFGLSDDGGSDAAVGTVTGTALLDRNRALERPELSAPAMWRHVAGPRRRLSTPTGDDQSRRVAAWLELLHLWKRAYGALADPSPPHTARLCTKLVTTPVALLCRLRDEPVPSVADSLARVAELAPDHLEAIVCVTRVTRDARRLPRPPVAEAVDLLAALSALVAEAIAEAVASAPRTEVALRGATPAGVPLCDWQALARPGEGGDAFTPRRTTLTAAVIREALGADGPLVGLADGPLVAFASARRSRVALRAIACAEVDPVSFALLAGRDSASFVQLDGWSIDHWSRRAVAERRQEALTQPCAPGLRSALASARAELLRLSLAGGAPLLTTTDTATIDLLVEQGMLAEAVASTCRAQLASTPGATRPEELARALRRLRAQS